MKSRTPIPRSPRSQGREISYDMAAKTLSVSKASILNWVKSGELTCLRRGYVSSASLIHFQDQIAGKTRLIARANKLYQTTKQRPVKTSEPSDSYEAKLGNTQQNKEGVYYTPPSVIDSILSKIDEDVSNLTFFDPCCGTGNFLLGALRRGFKPENIYGQDCDADALAIAKSRLETKTQSAFNTLTCADFLNPPSPDPAHIPQKKFDIIATNPPWGKKYTRQEKLDFAKSFGLSTPIGSSALFSFQAFAQLKDNGVLALLLPEACFKIAAFIPLRDQFLKVDIVALENHGRAFPSLITFAHSIVCRKTERPLRTSISCTSKNRTYTRTKASFARLPKSIFNFETPPKDMEIIEHIFGKPHITLKDSARWGLGIVTGRNKALCRDAPLVDDVAIFTGSDISKTGLKSPSRFLNPDLSRYRQTAPETLYRAPEKLIYKFISTRLVFFKDTEQRLILNSANMLILNTAFPLSHSQLCFLLNSDVMNFIFQKIFGTRKVLRSDLETLPIFHLFFEKHAQLSEAALLEYLGLEFTDDSYQILA